MKRYGLRSTHLSSSPGGCPCTEQHSIATHNIGSLGPTTNIFWSIILSFWAVYFQGVTLVARPDAVGWVLLACTECEISRSRQGSSRRGQPIKYTLRPFPPVNCNAFIERTISTYVSRQLSSVLIHDRCIVPISMSMSITISIPTQCHAENKNSMAASL